MIRYQKNISKLDKVLLVRLFGTLNILCHPIRYPDNLASLKSKQILAFLCKDLFFRQNVVWIPDGITQNIESPKEPAKLECVILLKCREKMQLPHYINNF